MSQTLQVIIIFWEVIDSRSLEEDFGKFYSYANDIISIMTLLSSCLRLPAYCTCNRPIARASVVMLPRCIQKHCLKAGEYSLVSAVQSEIMHRQAALSRENFDRVLGENGGCKADVTFQLEEFCSQELDASQSFSSADQKTDNSNKLFNQNGFYRQRSNKEHSNNADPKPCTNQIRLWKL